MGLLRALHVAASVHKLRFCGEVGWIPGRKAAGVLQRFRPGGQTGLRVEVILRLPEAALQGYRGKSGGRLDAFHPPLPSPAVLEAQRTPPEERPPEVKNH